MRRRAFLTLAAAAVALPATACAAPPRELVVHRTPWCGCCGGWVKHMRAAGFTVREVEVEDTAAIRARHGVADELSSCHTGVVGGYAVEGHVPAADVVRLLAERPKARGLTVPGMPIGSPGMEVPGAKREAYETLLIGPDGSTRVFARHA
ncbi:MAG TPA: DUF411 domain-containing protein [Caulobacteraceae bacterium]|nr:DUF411 domain-containing protein [Caulobacteraceae bacterium]